MNRKTFLEQFGFEFFALGLIIIAVLFNFLSGCAVASHTITMPDGTQYTDKTYRLFQSVSVSYFSKDTGLSYGTDQTLSNNLVALQGLAQVAGSIYGQSQGIPVKATTSPATATEGK